MTAYLHDGLGGAVRVQGDVFRAETSCVCPTCGYGFGAFGSSDAPPGEPLPGEYVLCLRCAEVAVFALGPLGQLVLRAPTNAEQLAFSRSPHAQAQTGLRAHRRRGITS